VSEKPRLKGGKDSKKTALLQGGLRPRRRNILEKEGLVKALQNREKKGREQKEALADSHWKSLLPEIIMSEKSKEVTDAGQDKGRER